MPPKIKIGAKVTAGENKKAERKVFNNGHKVFTASEAKVLTELQTQERRTVNNFELNKANLVRPRNPITGESTPRMIYDENGIGRQGGEPLFTSAQLQQQEKAALLVSSPPKVENELKRSDLRAARISSIQSMQDNINGELAYLRDKQRQLLSQK